MAQFRSSLRDNAGELWYIGEEENHEQDALGD
jgi:hypothetical protein